MIRVMQHKMMLMRFQFFFSFTVSLSFSSISIYFYYFSVSHSLVLPSLQIFHAYELKICLTSQRNIYAFTGCFIFRELPFEQLKQYLRHEGKKQNFYQNQIFLKLSQKIINKNMLKQKVHQNTSQQDEQTISQSYILQNGKKILTNSPGKELYNIRIKNKSYSLQIISLPQQHDFYEGQKVERILREIRAQYKTNYEKAAQIKSKNIVSPIQYFGYYDKVCIVEEQFECTLTSYMKENSLGYIDTLQVMKQLFQGVHDLHRAKIIHRTLNPQNIVVQVDKNKKLPAFKLCGLMDSFDFSKKMPKKAPESHSLLSQEMKKFRAPQIRLGSLHDEKIDVWSLGAIFVWILYGNFNRIKLFQNQQEKKQCYVDCSDKFPKWFTNFLNKLLSYDPKERYSISDGLSIINSALLCSDQTISILRNSGLEI